MANCVSVMTEMLHLGSPRIVIIFMSTHSMRWEEGVMGRCMLFKMSFMMHCGFDTESKFQNKRLLNT